MKLWKLLGLVVLEGVVVWGGIALFRQLTKYDLDGPGGEGRVVEAKLGELAVTVNASGRVAGPRQAQLSFESAGTISEIPARVGAAVKKGQVLARLEAASLERAVRQAESGLRTAQINLEKARNPYRIVKAETAVVQARAAFETARINLEKARLDGEIAVFVAQIALKTAQDDLGDVEINALADVRNAEVALANARQDVVIIRETHAKALREARKTLEDEEEDYTDLFEAHYGNIPTQEEIYTSLLEQTGRTDILIPQRVKDAHKALLDIKSDFDIDRAQAAKAVADARNDVAQAEDNLKNAQQDAADIMAGTRAIAVEIMEIEVKKAQAALDRVQAEFAGLEDGAAPLDVKIREGTVASTQAALRKAQAELDDIKGKFGDLDIELKELLLSNARIALDNAREDLDMATIVAPYDRIVAGAGHKVGNRVAAGIVIVQVIDTAEFEVKATVDELDVNQVTVGQAVQVSLDAIPEARLQGTVKSISPMAQTKPGVISYEAIISIPDPGRYALKDGMTTSNEIVVASRRSALLVPSKAVSQNGTEEFVTVIEDGKPQERAVRTGLSQDGQTEILEGLSQGEKVLVAE